MDKDAFLSQGLAADFGADESEDDTHKEDDDRDGGVGGDRGERDGGSEGEGALVGEIFDEVDGKAGKEGAEDFAVAGLIDGAPAAKPFAVGGHDDEVAEALAENNER